MSSVITTIMFYIYSAIMYSGIGTLWLFDIVRAKIIDIFIFLYKSIHYSIVKQVIIITSTLLLLICKNAFIFTCFYLVVREIVDYNLGNKRRSITLERFINYFTLHFAMYLTLICLCFTYYQGQPELIKAFDCLLIKSSVYKSSLLNIYCFLGRVMFVEFLYFPFHSRLMGIGQSLFYAKNTRYSVFIKILLITIMLKVYPYLASFLNSVFSYIYDIESNQTMYRICELVYNTFEITIYNIYKILVYCF